MARQDKGLVRDLPASFVRGMVATGLLAALQDKRGGPDLLRAALLGGGALSAAVGVEKLLFDKEMNVGKRKKGKNKAALAGLDPAKLEALRTLLGQPRPTGLAALSGGQQFLTGALLGAVVAYLLGDEAMRAKLIRAGVQLYSGIAGGVEEIKEQVADIQAEMAAGQGGG